MALLQWPWQQRIPRPILIFLAATESGFAYSGRSDKDLPRPILIFLAAKKNGPPATAVATTAFRVRI